MSFKNLVKSALKPLHKHQKEYADTYIITLGRTGSTLLAEILNTQKRLKIIGEPLSLNRHNKEILRRFFPESFLKERYIDLSEAEKQQMFAYFDSLAAGKTINSINWSDLGTGDHQLFTNRVVFKTHKITALLDEFLQKDSSTFIYLLRHPLSHSLSRMRNGWDTYISNFLQSPNIRSLLDPDQVQYLEKTDRSGERLQKFVASWCLENLVLFRKLQSDARDLSRLLLVTYEELIHQPEKLLPVLCQKLGLDYTERMLNKLHRPSKGIVHSQKQTAQEINSQNKAYLLSNWRKGISATQEEKAFDILERLNIDVYLLHEDLPNRKYCMV